MAGGGEAERRERSTTVPPALPPVIYRWIDEIQMRQLLSGTGMTPAWSHLCPDKLRVEKGISFGENPWRWHEGCDYVACVALSSERLPVSLRPILLHGHDAFLSTSPWRKLALEARRTADPGDRGRLRAKARAIAEGLARRHAADPAGDEWFLRGAIPDALGRTLAVATLNPGYRLERLLAEMEADGSLGFPVHRMDPYCGNDPMRLEAEARRAFADTDPTLAIVGAAAGPR